ncbi:MAG: class I SAM-dependent methyltransferase [Sulfuritalea sp.]|nr:class I SAM-dependent methyltransferase [Polynucleobacter sp.]MCF8188603.1 class I SAM-dependent methyltransferase [Sulfuritalea sp.]
MHAHAEVPSIGLIVWSEGDKDCSARWQSDAGLTPPKRVVVTDDTLTADSAYRLACEGVGILWRGDFQNARQLLQALVRRVERPSKKSHRIKATTPAAGTKDAFNLYRLSQSQRARTLGMLLIPFDAGHHIPLRRAPDVSQACNEAMGQSDSPYVMSLRELLGIISAHEWRKKGIEIPVLQGDNDAQRIHAHYGVFAPLRAEYLPLVANAALPKAFKKDAVAFDIGTGTGVIAALLAQRGFARVSATDLNPRALQCARENIQRLGLSKQVDVIEADLFPSGRAALVVCNPPWVPARPTSALEQAVFDPDSAMLRGFLAGVAEHLIVGGEAWLVLSDLAERLGLRTREELLEFIKLGGLKVVERLDARPTHKKIADENDPLHSARAAEITSLWRLVSV